MTLLRTIVTFCVFDNLVIFVLLFLDTFKCTVQFRTWLE